MELRALGPLVGVDRAGAPVDLGGRRQRLVLAQLLVAVNEPVSLDRLTLGVWADDPPVRARHTLQAYVSELRKLVPGGIERRSEAYILRLPAQSFDVSRFEALVADARARLTTDPHRALLASTESLGLWRGPPYDGLPGGAELDGERIRLEQVRLAASRLHVTALDATGQHEAAVEAGTSAVADAPLDEGLVAAYVIALYRSGRQADALRVLTGLRRRLGEEMGLDVTPATASLEDRILAHDPTLDVDPIAPLPSPTLDDRDVLGVVSLAHRPLTATIVAAVVEAPERDVVDRIERLAAEGSLVESTDGVTAPPDAVAAAVAGPTRLLSLAGRLADVLSSHGGRSDEVGRLLHRSGRLEEAGAILTTAAGATDEPARAIELAELALDAIDGRDSTRRGPLHVLLATRCREMGESVAAADHAERAQALLGGVERVAAIGFASVAAADLQDTATAEWWAAVGQIHALAIGDDGSAASLRTLHGRHLARLGLGAESDHAIDCGHAIVRRSGDERQRRHADLDRAWVAMDRGELRVAMALFGSLRLEAGARSGPVAEAPHLANWARAAWRLGDAVDADVACERVSEIAEGAGGVGALSFLAALARAEGAVMLVGGAARTACATAHSMAARFVPAWQNRTALLMARVEIAAGDTDRAARWFADARRWTPPGQNGGRMRAMIDAVDPGVTADRAVIDSLVAARWWAILGEALAGRGDRESALDALAVSRMTGDPALALRAVSAGDLWDHPWAAMAGRMVRAVSLPGWAEEAWDDRPDRRRVVEIPDASGLGEELTARFEGLVAAGFG